MISILICSFTESRYLDQCLLSLVHTLKNHPHEILVDVEQKATGLQDTPKRYYDLFMRSKGDIVVKSDDDVFYFDGWIEKCLYFINREQNLGYISPLNHHLNKKVNGSEVGLTPHPICPGDLYLEPQPFLCGACWVFKRDLWIDVPYGNLNGIKTLDSNFGRSVRVQTGKIPYYMNAVLCSHLGFNRHGGIET